MDGGVVVTSPGTPLGSGTMAIPAPPTPLPVAAALLAVKRGRQRRSHRASFPFLLDPTPAMIASSVNADDPSMIPYSSSYSSAAVPFVPTSSIFSSPLATSPPHLPLSASSPLHRLSFDPRFRPVVSQGDYDTLANGPALVDDVIHDDDDDDDNIDDYAENDDDTRDDVIDECDSACESGVTQNSVFLVGFLLVGFHDFSSHSS